jgi:hypothetical protein
MVYHNQNGLLCLQLHLILLHVSYEVLLTLKGRYLYPYNTLFKHVTGDPTDERANH